MLLKKQVVIPAGPDEVWNALTTSAGAVTFFAPAADVDPGPDGAFEILFAPDAPAGSRGSEGCRFLELHPKDHFAVSWNNPPSLPSIRFEYSRVDFRLESPGPGKTIVSMEHSGFREGDVWAQSYAYFDSAWDLVLARLQHRFLTGPLDWANPARPSIRTDL
jgi:uncharacterized protein YndB with AHSA1/START domain